MVVAAPINNVLRFDMTAPARGLRTIVLDGVNGMRQFSIAGTCPARDEFHYGITPASMRMEFLTGALDGQRWLAHPIAVFIYTDEEETVVTEPRYHIHGYGDTVEQAKSDFRTVLSDSLDILAEDEKDLDSYLREQLAYLRQVVVPA